MDKLTLYRYAALGMLILNLAILAFFFLYRPFVAEGQPGAAPSLRMLKMDKEQHEAFLVLADQHRTTMRSINTQQQEMLAGYFGRIAQGEAGQPPVIPQGYSALEAEKIRSTYAHFLEVKALLRPEQQEQFPAFVEQSLQHILGQRRQEPRRPRSE